MMLMHGPEELEMSWSPILTMVAFTFFILEKPDLSLY